MNTKSMVVLIAVYILNTGVVYAATATLIVNFNQQTALPQATVAAKSIAPVVSIVQSSTELNSFSSAVNGVTTAATASITMDASSTSTSASSDPSSTGESKEKPAKVQTRQTIKATIGVDSFVSDKQQIYAVPINYAFTPAFQLGLIVPLVSAKYDGMTKRETGVGDVSMTAKYLLGSEESFELVSMLTGKFASGDEQKALGTGSYDISITEKLIKHFDKFRCTLMGAYNQPLNEPTINGNKIKYGGLISYMGAIETNIVHDPLWFGVKASGIHSFTNNVNSISNEDAVSTFDVTSETKYFVTNTFGLNASVILPVVTKFEKISTSDKRDVVFNFGLVKAF